MNFFFIAYLFEAKNLDHEGRSKAKNYPFVVISGGRSLDPEVGPQESQKNRTCKTLGGRICTYGFFL